MPSGQDQTAGSTISILVVEDDEAVAELLRTLCSDVPGWGATVVHDAAAARAVFAQVRIDVLVLDISLPGISGLELLALLRQDPTWGDPAIIILSAAVDAPELHDAIRRAEATTIIPKPFDVDDVIAAIESAVAAS
jgi:CheY-like chemotaxis protein